MIKGIIFDCFGVLIADGLRARIEAVERMDPESGTRLRDILRAVDRGMMSREESTQQLGEIFGVEPDELRRSFDETLVKNTDLIAFIRTLKPSFKVGLLSNVRGRARLEELFSPGELDDVFDTVVASGDIGVIKPEREIYELTAEQLGLVPEDCVMIDDLPQYCEGAETVGMRAIQFMSTDQAKKDLLALIDSENQTD